VGLAQGVRGPLYIELCIKSKKERDESEQPFITPNSELFLFFFKLAQLNKNSKQAQVILFFAKSMPGKHTIPTASF